VSGERSLSASRLLTEPPMPMTKAARASAPSTPTTADLLQTGSRQEEAPASERSHKHLPAHSSYSSASTAIAGMQVCFWNLELQAFFPASASDSRGSRVA
jgi:hypothetical protein